MNFSVHEIEHFEVDSCLYSVHFWNVYKNFNRMYFKWINCIRFVFNVSQKKKKRKYFWNHQFTSMIDFGLVYSIHSN